MFPRVGFFGAEDLNPILKQAKGITSQLAGTYAKLAPHR
jgi:hypothetical protein